MANKTIIILGGGIGGIVAARELRKYLGSKHRVIIVDRNEVFSFSPSYLWVMVGWRKPESIQKPISLLETHGIEFHHAPVKAINTDSHTVETGLATLSYDYLIIALGAEHSPPLNWSTGEVHSFYTVEEAVSLSGAIRQFTGGTVAIVAPSLPYKSPPAAYEAAMLLESYFSRRGVQGVTVKIYTPESIPFHAAGAETGKIILELSEQRGIQVLCNSRIASADVKNCRLISEKGEPEPYDLLIAIPPIQAPSILASSKLTDETGWIPVDEKTMQTRHRDVFAIGDVTNIQIASGRRIPKIGVFAHNQAEIVAYNIAQEIHETGLRKTFTGTGFYFLETGNGRAGYIHANFLAEEAPHGTFNEPSVTYHWGKVVYEKYWLWRWF